MSPLVPALAGALIVAGIIGLITGLRPVPVDDTPKPPSALVRRLHRIPRRTLLVFLAGLLAGAVVWLMTGWILALLIGPAAALGMPVLLSTSSATAEIQRLEAMQEWTRALAGVLTVGVGLEQALILTLRSTPKPISSEVTNLVARLRSRWETERAIRTFADELDDATGDLVAAYLIRAARRRGAGLANVLEDLAESVAEDVRARRRVEADRAKPRATARWVTIISASVLVVLALTGSYVEPYGTPLGQVILAVLLAAYVATLVWLKRMAAGRPLPRILQKGELR